MTFIDFEKKMCRSCGLGASIAAFHPRDQGSNPSQSIFIIFSLGSTNSTCVHEGLIK